MGLATQPIKGISINVLQKYATQSNVHDPNCPGGVRLTEFWKFHIKRSK